MFRTVRKPPLRLQARPSAARPLLAEEFADAAALEADGGTVSASGDAEF